MSLYKNQIWRLSGIMATDIQKNGQGNAYKNAASRLHRNIDTIHKLSLDQSDILGRLEKQVPSTIKSKVSKNRLATKENASQWQKMLDKLVSFGETATKDAPVLLTLVSHLNKMNASTSVMFADGLIAVLSGSANSTRSGSTKPSMNSLGQVRSPLTKSARSPAKASISAAPTL